MLKLGMFYGIGILVAGDAVTSVDPILGPVIQFGALGVLAWVCYCQRQELRDIRKETTDTLKDLNETLRLLTANCAAMQAQRQKP